MQSELINLDNNTSELALRRLTADTVREKNSVCLGRKETCRSQRLWEQWPREMEHLGRPIPEEPRKMESARGPPAGVTAAAGLGSGC